MDKKNPLENLNAQLSANEEMAIAIAPTVSKAPIKRFEHSEKLYDIVLFSPAVIDKVASVLRERSEHPFSAVPLKFINKFPVIKCLPSDGDCVNRYYGTRLTFAVVGYFSDGIRERWVLCLFSWSDNAAVKGRIPKNIPGAPVELYVISSYSDSTTPISSDIIYFDKPLLIDGVFGGVFREIADDSFADKKNDDDKNDDDKKNDDNDDDKMKTNSKKERILLDVGGKLLPGVVRDYYEFLDYVIDKNVQRSERERTARIAFSRMTTYEKQVIKVMLRSLATKNTSQEEFILKLVALL